ncbi:MAG: MucB/RseB C-terminal domain-containing protein [Gammaproteobacteria bacterium]
MNCRLDGMRQTWSCAAFGLACVLGFPAWADSEPQEWIARMEHALDNLNYEGTLVQMHGDEASVMHVVHRVDGSDSAERITAMDEIGREIIRRGDEVTCIFPDQRTVVVGRRSAGANGASPLRQQFPDDIRFNDKYYRFAIASGGRLVGRLTWMITVKPMDQYRYGYRLWLDRSTAMPLKVQISAEDDSVVEQLLFSEISLPEQIPAAALTASVSTDGFTWRHSDTPASPATTDSASAVQPGWRAASLPPGFRLRTVRSRQVEGGDAPMEHLVYSDGIASVSVFVEAGVTASEQGEGVSRMGAANAYTAMNRGYLVTAVGEVPVRTTEMIARSLQAAEAVPVARDLRP